MLFDTYLPRITRRLKIRKISIATSIPILLMLVSTTPSQAQFTQLRGPTLTNISPSVPPQNYGLATGVSCPVTSFNIFGFYGGATDSAAGFNSGATNSLANSNSDLDNFGVAAGFSVPIGGSLSKQCRKNAKARTNLIDAKYHSDLVKYCLTLQEEQVDFNHSAYDENGPVAALFPCRAIVKSRKAATPLSRNGVDFDIPARLKTDEGAQPVIIVPQ